MSAQDLNFDLRLLLPELSFFLLVLFLFGAIICGLNKDRVKSNAVLNFLPIFTAFIVGMTICGLKFKGLMFWGSYHVDALSQYFKLLVAGGFMVAVLNARRQPTLEEGQRIDYFLFLTFSAWGLCLMASAAELVTIYLAMELASYSLYVLIPLRATEKVAA